MADCTIVFTFSKFNVDQILVQGGGGTSKKWAYTRSASQKSASPSTTLSDLGWWRSPFEGQSALSGPYPPLSTKLCENIAWLGGVRIVLTWRREISVSGQCWGQQTSQTAKKAYNGYFFSFPEDLLTEWSYKIYVGIIEVPSSWRIE